MARKDGGSVELKMRYRKEMLLEKERLERENKQEQGNKSTNAFILTKEYKHYNEHNEAIPGLHRLIKNYYSLTLNLSRKEKRTSERSKEKNAAENRQKKIKL